MQYKKTMTLLAIPMPTHLQYERPPGKKQDGINLADRGIPIEDLTEDEANEYGEFLKQSFIKGWKQGKAMEQN